MSSSSKPRSHTDPFSKKYKILSKIGEGSYSEVLKCKNRETGAIYACKRLKHCYRSWNQVNDIPEIVTLRKLARHPNILQMVEIHFDPTAGRVSLIFELMDMNLYELIKDRKRLLPESRVRVMMFQLIRALRHLHKHGIFHRDVKPENILLGGMTEQNDLLKLGDLGSVRGLYSRPPYTEYISTRWYRSPECLLTCGYYSFKMDIWSVGCVFYEILTLRPLFPGSSELDQINRVHNVLGPPPNKVLQKFLKHAEIERDYSRHTSKQARLETIKRVLSEMKNSSYEWYFTGKEPKGVDTLLPTHVTADAKDLLKHLLQYDPDSRPSSHRALQHAYFKDLREQAQRAAREKAPTMSGPIVTIVGDEGGLEVAADDNANPVDLTTLGDGKLKAPIRRTSDIKEVKESLSINQSKKLIPRKEPSSGKIVQYESSPTSMLKEAGEMFSSTKPEVLMEKKQLATGGSSSNYEPRRTEERVKLVERTMANLRFGGDFAQSPSSLSYQKMYFWGDEEGREVLSTSQVNEVERKNKSSHLSRRRGGGGGSKLMEVERKKSMTITSSHDSSSGGGGNGRGFPLDFIDKTSLTSDVLVRINENRRIAHMQPITSSELKKVGRGERDSHYQSPSKEKEQQQQLYYFSKPPRSPFEFSPRNYQQQQQQQSKAIKGNHNQMYSLVKGNSTHLNSDGRDSYVHNSTNKQVREILAEMRKRRDMLEDKVTREPTLQNWTRRDRGGEESPTTISGQNSLKTSPKSKISESTVKRLQNFNNLSGQGGGGAIVRGGGVSEPKERKVNEDLMSRVGSTTYRFNSNNNTSSIKNSYQTHSYQTQKPVKQLHNQSQTQQQHHHHSSAELSPVRPPDKSSPLRRRKQQQQEQVYSNKMKIGRQPSIIVKYLDSEPNRIKSTKKSPSTTDSSKNNLYHQQSQTGAGSKIFPRNRWENNSQHKQ